LCSQTAINNIIEDVSNTAEGGDGAGSRGDGISGSVTGVGVGVGTGGKTGNTNISF
jgi:hypothetical protein